VRVDVLGPNGEQVGTGQTTPAEQSLEVSVQTGDHAGQVWSLQVTRADEGTLEDNSTRLDPKLPPVLSLTPEHVFGVGEGP
jgi:hypothetical protein